MTNEEIKDALLKSPTFQLSLSSKELFHSNLMCWLADSYRRGFTNMLKEIVGDKPWLTEFAENKCIDTEGEVPKYVVEREKMHNDFAIWQQVKKRGFSLSHPVLVLENKLKSVPDEFQLWRYAERFKWFNDVSLILLHMIEPDFDLGKWHSLSYESYADLIKTHILPEIKDTLSKELVLDYCDNFILNVCKLAKEWSANELMDNKADCALAKELRIDDLRQKIQFSKMAKELRGMVPDMSIEIISNFTNGSGLLDCKLQLPREANAPLYKIGIQIQGMQYRRFIECDKPESLDALTAIARERFPWFFKDKPFKKDNTDTYGSITLNKLSPYRKKKYDHIEDEKMFCKYSTNFIYQYRKIKEDATIDAVLVQVVNDMQDLKTKLLSC